MVLDCLYTGIKKRDCTLLLGYFALQKVIFIEFQYISNCGVQIRYEKQGLLKKMCFITNDITFVKYELISSDIDLYVFRQINC